MRTSGSFSKLLCIGLSLVCWSPLVLYSSRGQTHKKSIRTSKPVRTVRTSMDIRGMTLSCHGWGAAWATQRMYQEMNKLRNLGSNWISYHPYAWIRNDGTLRFNHSLQQPSVLRSLAFGQQLKMHVLLKPHIGYWGSRFRWRGAIHFAHEKEWKRFFRSYTRWIVLQARLAQRGRAALFSIGVEYQKTLHREADWRRVIRAVRKVYTGPLTYSANWDAYHKVPFWDALDYIGIQAYFPLSKQSNPSVHTLHQAWKPIFQSLRAFSKKHRKKIIFTELGYNRASHTAARPWDHQEGGKNALQIKSRCVRVALQEVRSQPYILGAFLWKWFPSPSNDASNYTLQYPAMKQILQKAWKR